MRLMNIALASILAGSCALAEDQTADSVKTPTQTDAASLAQPANKTADDGEFVIPNAPILKPTNIITVRAIGLGAANPNTVSRAQTMAMAKRAAIIDAYRQIGEKLHGIRIESRDTVKDAMLVRSEVRTAVNSVVRGAEIVETVWDNDLCQVEMEVKLDGRRWYGILAGSKRK